LVSKLSAPLFDRHLSWPDAPIGQSIENEEHHQPDEKKAHGLGGTRLCDLPIEWAWHTNPTGGSPQKMRWLMPSIPGTACRIGDVNVLLYRIQKDCGTGRRRTV